MLSLRNRFGIPGVISVIALVFAMLGGAYAANNSGGGKATASAKAKRGPKGPKGATGPAGPMGPAGPAGPAGAKGDAGSNGTNGANGTSGTNGKTVLNGSAVPTAGVGTVGDFYIMTSTEEIFGPKAASGSNGGWGSGTPLEGPEGAPGPEGVCSTSSCHLPANVTETGAWSVEKEAGFEGTIFPVISFSIPLAAGLDGSHVVYVGAVNPDPTHCTGSLAEPKAASGYLCVYEAVQDPKMTFLAVLKLDLSEPGTFVSGAVLAFSVSKNPLVESPSAASGSWAVTG